MSLVLDDYFSEHRICNDQSVEGTGLQGLKGLPLYGRTRRGHRQLESVNGPFAVVTAAQAPASDNLVLVPPKQTSEAGLARPLALAVVG